MFENLSSSQKKCKRIISRESKPVFHLIFYRPCYVDSDSLWQRRFYENVSIVGRRWSFPDIYQNSRWLSATQKCLLMPRSVRWLQKCTNLLEFMQNCARHSPIRARDRWQCGENLSNLLKFLVILQNVVKTCQINWNFSNSAEISRDAAISPSFTPESSNLCEIVRWFCYRKLSPNAVIRPLITKVFENCKNEHNCDDFRFSSWI